jgi:nucleoredoxin
LFRAHWCPTFINFTPKLTKVFSELTKEMKDKFDIVFISWDEDEESFKEYFSEMPWKALPFAGLLLLLLFLFLFKFF